MDRELVASVGDVWVVRSQDSIAVSEEIMDKFLIRPKTKGNDNDEADEQVDDNHDCISTGGIIGSWTHIKRKQLFVSLAKVARPGSKESRRFFRLLEKEVTYLPASVSRVKVFNKWHQIPRKQAGYGDPGVSYAFSGTELKAEPWTPVLQELRVSCIVCSTLSQ